LSLLDNTTIAAEPKKHPNSDNEWKDDLTLVLKNSRNPLTKNKKSVLNKIWNIYK